MIRKFFFAVLAACGLLACLHSIDQVNNTHDDAVLLDCRTEMRTAREAGADASSAFKTYYDCTVDGGMR